MGLRALRVALLLICVASGAVASERVSLADLVFQPVKYEHRMVVVRGVVGLIEEPGSPSAPGGPSRQGRTGQRFQLMDGGVSMTVIAPALPAVRLGDRLEVEGTFRFNAIEAFHMILR